MTELVMSYEFAVISCDRMALRAFHFTRSLVFSPHRNDYTIIINVLLSNERNQKPLRSVLCTVSSLILNFSFHIRYKDDSLLCTSLHIGVQNSIIAAKRHLIFTLCSAQNGYPIPTPNAKLRIPNCFSLESD